ncbi:MAG: redoxin domain-containing protein [Firmicutes bacterium]|nr:redoxin domain-containing protein [Bacillota bacterium]
MQPELAELREQGIDSYVVAVGSREELIRVFNKLQLEATIIHDSDFSIFQKYSVVSIPKTILVDKEGRAAFAQVGWGYDTLEQEIRPLLTELVAE